MIRRQFLAGASGLALGSVAGCAGVLGGGASPADWTVAADFEADHDYELQVVRPSRLAELDEDVRGSPSAYRSWVQFRVHEFDLADLDTAALVTPDAAAGVGSYGVYDGSFGADELVDEVETYVDDLREEADDLPDDVGHVGSHEDYELYRLPGSFLAVREGRLVDCFSHVSDGSSRENDVERILDAVEDGDESVLHWHRGLPEVARRLDQSAVQWDLSAQDPERAPGDEDDGGPIATGRSTAIGGDEATFTLALAYQSADDVAESVIAERADRLEDGSYETADYEIDGEVAELTATGPATDVFSPAILPTFS